MFTINTTWLVLKLAGGCLVAGPQVAHGGLLRVTRLVRSRVWHDSAGPKAALLLAGCQASADMPHSLYTQPLGPATTTITPPVC